MGCVDTIHFLPDGTLRFPRQSDWVGQRVRVCFHYQTEPHVWGTVVRDDREPPGETLIALDDGPLIRATECQHGMPELLEADAPVYARSLAEGPSQP